MFFFMCCECGFIKKLMNELSSNDLQTAQCWLHLQEGIKALPLCLNSEEEPLTLYIITNFNLM